MLKTYKFEPNLTIFYYIQKYEPSTKNEKVSLNGFYPAIGLIFDGIFDQPIRKISVRHVITRLRERIVNVPLITKDKIKNKNMRHATLL